MAPVMCTDARASDRASIFLAPERWPHGLQRTTEFRQSWGFGFPLDSIAMGPAAISQHGCRERTERLCKETAMGKALDVIVMGARCAGSPTAMLLAHKG